MGKAEARVETYLAKRVKEEGGHVRKLKWIGRNGAPDRLIWWTFPRIALVECKSADGDLEPSQQREIPRMIRDGWPVYVVSSRDEVDLMIAEVKNRGN